MNSSPLVSVLIPCYNAQDYLAETLDSVISQTYRNLEVIIVDDGSTDLSRQILLDYAKKDERIQLFFQPNKGPSAARNKAFEISKGEWIQYLDADDLLNPFKIEGQIRASKIFECKNKIIYGDIVNISLDGSLINQEFPKENFNNPIDFLFVGSFGCGNTGAHLFSREVIIKSQPWREGINIYEDLDFCTKAIINSSCMIYAANTTYFYRKPDGRNTLSTQSKYFTSSESWFMVKSVAHEVMKHCDKKYYSDISKFIFVWFWNVYPALPLERREALQLIEKLGFTPKKIYISKKSHFFINFFGLYISLFFLFLKRNFINT